MAFASRLNLAWKALRELGPGALGYYAWYQLLLRSGYLRWVTKDERHKTDVRPRRSACISGRSSSDPIGLPAFRADRLLGDLPDPEALRNVLGEAGLEALRCEAEEIVSGNVRLFGGEPVPLRLKVDGPLRHWTEYKPGWFEDEDIKFTWEPGRFAWATTLARAYFLLGDERYPASFWEYTEAFLEANPPYRGPHWISGQEAALRLIALVFSAGLFAGSVHSTPERMNRLGEVITSHARRIPPSLSYALSQNNNHLLSEAAGLYTAGLALQGDPQAGRWREMGWRWFHWGILHQIDGDGAYVQHSTNYHRLMLQLALWMQAISAGQGQTFPEVSLERLAAGTRWLLAMTDPKTGRLPNLGPNDGAYILPLTVCPFHDYRPVLQAAARVFLHQAPFPPGLWEEMALYIGNRGHGKGERGHGSMGEEGERTVDPLTPHTSPLTPNIIHNPTSDSWAYLRAARFRSRPGHADQLHLDLWWRGLNIAQDAGSYLYNAPPPWDNVLSRSCVHNTLTVAGQDQMTRAGRFLWLDRAQAEVIAHERAGDGSWERLVARHDGFNRLGLEHHRSVTAFNDGRWVIVDSLLHVGTFERSNVETFSLHWLLPDWEWEVHAENREQGVENSEKRVEIRVRSVFGPIQILISTVPDGLLSALHSPLSRCQIIRAGEVLYGGGEAAPYMGWVSPSYGRKVPALSLTVSAVTTLPFSFITEWRLPELEDPST